MVGPSGRCGREADLRGRLEEIPELVERREAPGVRAELFGFEGTRDIAGTLKARGEDAEREGRRGRGIYACERM